MQILKSKKTNFSYKKGRSFLLLPFFLCAISCKNIDPAQYGRVTLHNTGDNNSFIFSVNDEFSQISKKSPIDKKNPRITEAESKLLMALLEQKKYCLDKNGDPHFLITSRQEKIFDMTFAHLIEQNYRARPIAPRMYFGQCQPR